MLQTLFSPDVLELVHQKVQRARTVGIDGTRVPFPGRDVRLEYMQLAILHVESPLVGERAHASRFREELGWLVDCNVGQMEPGEPGTAVVTFQQAQGALETAIALQRSCCDLRLRIGLASGRCVVAVFREGDQWHTVALGPSLERAASCARSATYGSILVSAESYEQFQDAILDHAADCVLTEEFFGEELARASITPAPSASAELSSFAGLGLM